MLKKVTNVKLKSKSNGLTTPLSISIVNKYRNANNCMMAYNDKNNKFNRQSYFVKCKNSIQNELNNYYK